MTDTKKMIAAGVIVLIIVLFMFVSKKTNNGNFSKAVFPQVKKTASKSPEQTIRDNGVILIENASFLPANLVMKEKETVTFVNKDKFNHTAVADDGSFDTGTISPNSESTIVLNKTGTISYHCSFHPEMKGTIMVE